MITANRYLSMYPRSDSYTDLTNKNQSILFVHVDNKTVKYMKSNDHILQIQCTSAIATPSGCAGGAALCHNYCQLS